MRDALQSSENELWLSPISVWEAMVTNDIAIMSRQLTLTHQDPADRFLAATARVMGLALVTADERLLGSTEYDVMANG